MLTALQDYEIGLAGMGDGERSSGDCDTRILTRVKRYHCSALGCTWARLGQCLVGSLEDYRRTNRISHSGYESDEQASAQLPCVKEYFYETNARDVWKESLRH